MPKTKQDLLDIGYVEYQLQPVPPEGESPRAEVLMAPDGELLPVYNDEVSDEDFVKHQNRTALHAKLIQARDYFGGNFQNWGSLTPAQKEQANRQAQRALANIARYLLRDLSGAGD